MIIIGIKRVYKKRKAHKKFQIMEESVLTPWLLEKIQTGEAILFLGAGALSGAVGSKGERPYLANQLRDLISDKFLKGEMKDKQLALVAEYAKYESSLSDVQLFIKSIYEPLRPADFHLLIPTFRWHAIVTTNYDFVIERAYDNAKEKLQKLAPLIRDGDNFSQKIKDTNSVPYLKLHGCLSVTNDKSLPLILASEEYAKHKINRKRLFGHFKDWALEHPIIFCGYDISDPNIQQILFDLSDQGLDRPMYAVVKRSLSELDIRYWQARRFVPVKGTFEDFLRNIDIKIPKLKRTLAKLIDPAKLPLSRWFVTHLTPSTELVDYLDKHLEYVHDGMTTHHVRPEDFYKGLDNSWGVFVQDLDVRRRIIDDVLLEAVLDSKNQPNAKAFMVLGYAGSGKSVSLKRIAWEAVNECDSLVFFLRDGGIIRSDLIGEIYALVKVRLIIVIDDAIPYIDDVLKLITYAQYEKVAITLLLGARTNEWNVYGENLDSKIEHVYEVRDLSHKEIREILAKLRAHKSLGGNLEKLDENQQFNYFHLTAERQLLVALHRRHPILSSSPV